jgi:hypothetical protein
MANFPVRPKRIPRPSSVGSASSLRVMPDGTYSIQPPTAAPSGKSYRDMILQEVFGRKSASRAQPARTLDKKTGQWVATREGEPVLRDRPDFIMQAMLSENPAMRQLVAEGFQGADPEIKALIEREIYERFPVAPQQGGVTIGSRPDADEILGFLETGQLAPERLREIEAASVDVPGIAQSSERAALGGGNPDIAAETFALDPDAPLDASPESNLPFLSEPPDPRVSAGARKFPAAQGIDLSLVNERLESRPYLRTGATKERVAGDKVNPKKDRYTTDVEDIGGEGVPVRIAPDPSAGSIGPQDNPAVNAAKRGRRPYPTDDLRAERSVAEGGDQRTLAEALNQLGRGDRGAEDRVWSLVKQNKNPALAPSDLNSGVPSAEALVDHALSLITDPNVRGMIAFDRGFDGWRQQVVDAINDRFWAPEGSVVRLTPEDAALRDAAFDAEAIDPMSAADGGPAYPGDLAATPQEAGDLFNRTGNVTGRGPGGDGDFVLSGPPDLKPGPFRGNVQGIHGEGPLPEFPAPVGAEGNVGLAGAPQSLRQSQAADPYPQGLGPRLRPNSAIPGRGPRKGKGYNRDVDDLPATYDITAISERGPIRLQDRGILPEDDGTRVEVGRDGQAVVSQNDPEELARRNSIAYAHSQGRAVYTDPDSGHVMAKRIAASMKPETINKVRALARMQFEADVQGAFDSLWPAGEPPLPEYFNWAQASTAQPRQVSQTTPAPQSSLDEIRAFMENRRADDARRLEDARNFYSQFGFPRDRIPPGFIRRTDGEVLQSPYGFDQDELARQVYASPDPNDPYYDGPLRAGEIDDTDDSIFLDSSDEIENAPAPRAATSGPDPWDEVDRIITGEDGTPIPAEAAGAVELSQEVARIYDDPTASPEDLAWARKTHEELRAVLDVTDDPELARIYYEDVLSPLPDAGSPDVDLGPDIEEVSSDVVVNVDPVPRPAPRRMSVGEVLEEARRASGEGQPQIDQSPQASNVDEALDAAATEIGDPVSAAGNDIETQMRDAGYVWDQEAGRYVKAEQQPSAQSADNLDPQEPPQTVEDAARNASNEAEGPRDAQASEADAQARADAAAPSEGSPAPTPNPAPTPGMIRRVGDHFQNNKLRYALAAGAAGATGYFWNRDQHTNPYPGIDFEVQGQGALMSPALSPEDRIRAIRASMYSEPQNTIRSLRGH